MPDTMSETARLLEFHARQLSEWPAAAERYEALSRVQVREISVGGFPVRLQFNPARAVSTGAKVDAASIAARPCFLCAGNRPQEQKILDVYEGIDTLVNPFPIFSRHFTLASRGHVHQDTVDFAEMGRIALTVPGLVVFYNGSMAGASAPDHLHLQAGEKEFLPVCGMLESDPGDLMKHTAGYRAFCPGELPMSAVHFVSRTIDKELTQWLDTLLPADEDSGLRQKGLRNVLMWADDEGMLHTLFLPRRAHRPACYYKEEGEGRLMVSPGAVDMAGVLILPRQADFESITRSDIRRIYDEVSFDYKDSAQLQRLLLL